MEQKIPLYSLKHPVTFVIFGITGDLARKKLLPSLWDLYHRGNIVKEYFSVIGFSRSLYTNQQFREYVQTILLQRDPSLDEAEVKNFSECFLYEAGDFLEASFYETLKLRVRQRDTFLKRVLPK
jgi:glucose-6-phosphate 1-dehydrogenase